MAIQHRSVDPSIVETDLFYVQTDRDFNQQKLSNNYNTFHWAYILKGDCSVAHNYRPISLTSICCKILEHIIFTNIVNHFDCHSDRQHGFRSKHSTESQLMITTQDLAQSLNKKLQIDMIIMDFSKAFDTGPHNRLLNKLNRYGIRNKTHNWMSNFRKYRKQSVVIGGEHSIFSVVPQGTVLGPLLFLTYINYLPNNIHSSIRLFADEK